MNALVEMRDGDVAVVAVPLEKLDMSTANEFKRVMAPIMKDNRHVVLDLNTVTFVDSSGLGAILSCLRELSSASGDLKLCQVQKRVRVMLELVRMHRILSIHDTAEDAVRAFVTSGTLPQAAVS